jgi:hypothetical protein
VLLGVEKYEVVSFWMKQEYSKEKRAKRRLREELKETRRD